MLIHNRENEAKVHVLQKQKFPRRNRLNHLCFAVHHYPLTNHLSNQ